jgi:hypothetical protein
MQLARLDPDLFVIVEANATHFAARLLRGSRLDDQARCHRRIKSVKQRQSPEADIHAPAIIQTDRTGEITGIIQGYVFFRFTWRTSHGSLPVDARPL